ncbi:A/G-specific adenine glycosylase [Svornostia abyssi]|uniref:A/G-specific adenine glycosylase n=1 Tax=Svornostia abyssi TaxID=2898438 RepID=A0ABY5PE64_9ACTN|nr:A/G-specific adenine glycosylase [Parviterribacteraceae bacterium J379]
MTNPSPDAALQDTLLRWYDAHARDLPWRRTRDPYAVLVSEIMLQQTQVARVAPRFEAWLERWPDIHALAAATPADVLREWVGLGYNRRALRLRECAQVVARDGWPRDAAGLRGLPGVGPYTAAAVAAFAFGEVVAAVDVNHARVVSRVCALGDAPPRVLAARAQELVPPDRPDAWNHALMDLGATICRARSADCPACPVRAACASAGAVRFAPRPAAGRPAVRFEDTDRYVRGRVIAALAAGDALPGDVGEERLERALAGLAQDGLVVRDGREVRLP